MTLVGTIGPTFPIWGRGRCDYILLVAIPENPPQCPGPACSSKHYFHPPEPRLKSTEGARTDLMILHLIPELHFDVTVYSFSPDLMLAR
ncbi:hypothetical protein VTI28DRAFT_6446 [Corynascus sepedonium]